MDSSDEEFFASPGTLDLIMNPSRDFSVHPLNNNRREDGEFYRLYPDLREYPEKFRSYTRMDMATFDYILDIIKPKLMKDWTNFNKEPIFPNERLIVTLRHLETGSSFTTIGFSFRMGRSTVATIVRETCQVMWETLQPIFMPQPTEQMFRTVAEEFWTKWNFPNCIGAIDGKHIRITCPAASGSMFYNYKGFHSIVLQAVADANSRFLMIEIGGYGKQSDGGTFNASDMFQLINEGKLNIPSDTRLPDPELSTTMPHVFIGDEAYPLLRNLLRSFPRSNLFPESEYFNVRFSRARNSIECSLGIINAKWRLLKPIETTPDFADVVVKAVCILHNVIIDHEGLALQLEEAAELNLTDRKTISNVNRMSTKTETFVRKYFMNFLT